METQPLHKVVALVLKDKQLPGTYKNGGYKSMNMT